MLLDVHAHPPSGGPGRSPNVDLVQDYVDALARFDARAVVSQLRPGPNAPPDLADWERLESGNEYASELVQRYPDRLIGYCTVHPRYTKQALEELERRLVQQRHLFAALKMHSLVYCDDPLYDPLMEFCAAHDVPVLQHTWKKVGPEGPGSGNNPNEPTPERLVRLARRHPTVKFFGGHGGGDWEWGAAAFKQVDNIWLDIGGGESIHGFMDLALRALGPSRIVFGTDIWGRSIPSQASRVVACKLSDDDLERIFWRNGVEVLG
ncbi:MAG TPA: amidohydrolase family protein, partial [Chloroflexota bacterium]|nr:amidohydrolase family protein [Chloroflexota bacterium]